MGVRILYGDDMAALYCSTSDWAFGPVFSDRDDHTAEERAEAFCDWLKVDPRPLTDSELEGKYGEFLKIEREYWKNKEESENSID